jgi:hypothetical protein
MTRARISFIALLVVCLAMAVPTTARPRAVTPDLPAGLVAADVPTGTLVDLAAPLAGLERFTGAPDSPPATTGLWRQMLFELRRASLVERGWPAPRELERRALAGVPPEVVPVALLDAVYDRLRPDAPRGKQRWDGADLASGRVFAAAALRPVTYHGARIELAFAADWCVGGLPPRLDVDPDDGGGWRPVGSDGRLAVSYAATGARTLRLRATTADGALRHAAFALEVAALQTPQPTETWSVTASVPYDGVAGAGSAYVYLADGHAQLANPVVVVEGFDLDDTMGWDVLYELLNQEQLIENLRAEGYDAVVLDFASATAPIQRNAFVLTELLGMVRAAVGPQRTSALIGASMGGLVSRYALGWLAQQQIESGVRTWIAFDSPQRGAVIPLGLQHWLDFFQDDAESAAFLLSRLDTPAARQLLLQHHLATSGTTAAADPLRAAFEADLQAVGLPPCRRVAVANGSGAAANQGFAPAQQIIRYEYNSFLVDVRGNVWAVPQQTSARIFQGVINVIWPLPDTYQDVNVAGAVSWDGAPGGWRASMAQMDTTSVPYGDIEALFGHHCFIPTVSSLDLAGVGPLHDVLADPDLMSRTSFDVLHVPLQNQEHVTITPESAAWFLDEVREGVTEAAEPPQVAAAPLRAYPNPFNPSTTVSFALPSAGHASLEAFDLRGRRVAVLLDAELPAGRHASVWNGRAGDAPLAAGPYLLRLRAPGGTRTARVMLVE